MKRGFARAGLLWEGGLLRGVCSEALGRIFINGGLVAGGFSYGGSLRGGLLFTAGHAWGSFLSWLPLRPGWSFRLGSVGYTGGTCCGRASFSGGAFGRGVSVCVAWPWTEDLVLPLSGGVICVGASSICGGLCEASLSHWRGLGLPVKSKSKGVAAWPPNGLRITGPKHAGLLSQI